WMMIMSPRFGSETIYTNLLTKSLSPSLRVGVILSPSTTEVEIPNDRSNNTTIKATMMTFAHSNHSFCFFDSAKEDILFSKIYPITYEHILHVLSNDNILVENREDNLLSYMSHV